MRDDLLRAVELLNAGRMYAPFFEWTDKEGKELGVAEEFVEALNAQCAVNLSRPMLQSPDPPDVVYLSTNESRIGIEIAEVVCEEAVRRNAKGESVYRTWRPGELRAAVTELLERKDGKAFHGGPFAKLFVCLFTDEPALTVEAARTELALARFGPFKQIARSFLLFSYQPSTQTYPVIELEHHE